MNCDICKTGCVGNTYKITDSYSTVLYSLCDACYFSYSKCSLCNCMTLKTQFIGSICLGCTDCIKKLRTENTQLKDRITNLEQTILEIIDKLNS